jgi:hypothetical protein
MNAAPDGTKSPYRPYKKMPEWKLWAISIALAVLVTPLFVLWRLGVLAGRAHRFDRPPVRFAPDFKQREAAKESDALLDRGDEDEAAEK